MANNTSNKRAFTSDHPSRRFSRRAVLSLVGSGIGASVTPRIVTASDRQNGPSAGPLRVTETSKGHFFVDQHGRTVILHGVNVGKKTPPFIRPKTEFDETDIERIRSWGFNAVRLGVIWEGVEPSRGVIDETYLDRVEELVRQFTDHNIHVLIDMHQDLYSREFLGDGAPSWAVYTDGIEFERTDPWQLDHADPAVLRAFDHFWQNDYSLQEEFAASVTAVARRIGAIDGVIGYDLLNEPSPGDITAVGFEQIHLPKFYNRITRALREVDESTPIWVEPPPTFGVGVPSALTGVAAEQLAFSFHNYADVPVDYIDADPDGVGDLIGDELYEVVMANGREKADQLDAVPVLTEFSPGNEYTDIDQIADLADKYLTGWTYWAYKNWGTRTSGTAGTMADDEQVVDVLVRPYPPAIAGVPEQFSFDRETRRFTLAYEPTDASRKTVVFVPDRQYPSGYEIDVDGGSVTSTNGQYLRIRHDRSAAEVEVEIEPA